MSSFHSRPWRWTILVYLASRVLLLAVALVAAKVNHISLASEIGRWDGTWYAKLASQGYPMHVTHEQTTLGFFPLYPILIWLTVHVPGPPGSFILAGVIVSLIGGLVATIVEATVWALLHLLRLVLLGVLAIFEPIVRAVLSLLSLGGLFTAGLYFFAGSPGLRVSYGILIAFSLGCALLLALYEGALNVLNR